MPIHRIRIFVIALAMGSAAVVPPAAAQPKPLVVVGRAEIKDGVPYDAWIGFKDKGNPSRREQRMILAALEKEFDPRALERRKANRNGDGLFDERDWPIAAEYLKGVAAAGAKVQVKSRWLNGVTVIVDRGVIEKLERLPFVREVTDFHLRKPRAQAPEKKEPSAKPAAPAPNAKPATAQPRPSLYGVSDGQISRLNLGPLHAAGYTGRGVRLAVIDCGFDLSSEAFRHPDHSLRVVAQWDFVENDGEVRPRAGIDPGNYTHGTLVLGAIAAYLPGVIVGSAFDADFILANAEDGDEEYYLEERWFTAALEYAEARGADIVTTSLVLYYGYKYDQTDGKTSVMARGMNIATANGMICFTGAGNDGHDADPATGTLSPPADSADVISVGAVGIDGKIARFSSDGPTADGRLKPEVLSQGSRVASVSVADPKGYSFASGTSLATPVLAGAGACILQARPGLTVREFRKALFESGDFWRREGRTDPLFVQGYGVPDAYRAAGLEEKR